MKFRIAYGSVPGVLADGRPYGPGDELDLTRKQLDEPHNAQLLTGGVLLGETPAARKAADEAEEAA